MFDRARPGRTIVRRLLGPRPDAEYLFWVGIVHYLTGQRRVPNGGYLRDGSGQRSSRSATDVPELERPDRFRAGRNWFAGKDEPVRII
jgi:hypothetical protein